MPPKPYINFNGLIIMTTAKNNETNKETATAKKSDAKSKVTGVLCSLANSTEFTIENSEKKQVKITVLGTIQANFKQNFLYGSHGAFTKIDPSHIESLLNNDAFKRYVAKGFIELLNSDSVTALNSATENINKDDGSNLLDKEKQAAKLKSLNVEEKED